ncbi:CDP-diacylglycerol diphosphatase [Mesorhizobium sp. BR1-1-16]|uniref:CDP-diacylglycerol diphosphatase n=1 Tax=Mesorhizobium sp. BR1-1-16 TaxID=2876653 RepID=UPI001CC9CB6F|nr:CDP-diacylglycerol diphosphatase [Mesorhizobium sp. BR1-1-16]MBZ9936309.1 CDP-diacylglycerol diphosphatase [Mesorhizobium sp. BR1-1-16]
MSYLVRMASLGAVLGAGFAMAALLAIEPIEAHSRNALALSVDSCVIATRTLHVPFPCLAVDLADGKGDGYAVIRPPLGRSEVLLVPTTPITGIESPDLLGADAPPLFQDAWAASRYVVAALPRDPGRTALGMAVNSRPSRSQDRLHIHVDCLRPRVVAALARFGPRIGDSWTRVPLPLFGGRYWARQVSASSFKTMNPFKLMHDGLPLARRSMADMTLVIAGTTLPDGRPGFMLLAANTRGRGLERAVGEDLLDHACRLANAG